MDFLLLQQQTAAIGYQCKFDTVVRGVSVFIGGVVIGVVAGVGFVAGVGVVNFYRDGTE